MKEPLNHHFRARFGAALLMICFVLAGVPARAEDPQLQFTKVSSRTGIVDIANAGDGSGRLFLVEQRGRIFIHVDGETLAQPFLNMSGRVGALENEQGLLSVAFAPNATRDIELVASFDNFASTTNARSAFLNPLFWRYFKTTVSKG